MAEQPLNFDQQAQALLAQNCVSSQAYVAWARIKLRRRVLGYTILIAGGILCAVSLFAVRIALESGYSVKFLTSVGCLAVPLIAVIMALALWSYKNSYSPAATDMFQLALLRYCTANFMQSLSPEQWQLIQSTVPASVNTPIESYAPQISEQRQNLMASLSSWRRLSGWLGLAFFGALMVSDKIPLTERFVIGAMLIALGTHFVLRGAQTLLAGKYFDGRSGAIQFGRPAQLLSWSTILFGVGLIIFGIFGLIDH